MYNVNRFRKETYVLRHEEEGTMQVGSTCINDFLGGNSPDNILSQAEFLSQLITYMSGMQSDGFGFGLGKIVFSIERVLAQTVACIRDHGWLSKSKAVESCSIPTATWVLDNLDPPREFKKFSFVTDEDKVRAKLAAEWVENLTDAEVDSSDYLYNIRAIARSGMVDYSTIGFSSSIISAYDRAIRVLRKKATSIHIGQLKKRELFSLILKHHFVSSGNYGDSHRYIFEDDNGNVVVWKASSPHNLIEGTRYGVKGTVKEHSNYKGIEQTILTRCEVLIGNKN